MTSVNSVSNVQTQDGYHNVPSPLPSSADAEKFATSLNAQEGGESSTTETTDQNTTQDDTEVEEAVDNVVGEYVAFGMLHRMVSNRDTRMFAASKMENKMKERRKEMKQEEDAAAAQ
jgi:hypothetical protein